MLVFITDLVLGGRQTFCRTLVNTLVGQGEKIRLYVSYQDGAEDVPNAEIVFGGGSICRHIWRLFRFVRRHPDEVCLTLSSEITIVMRMLKMLRLITNPIVHRESMDASGLTGKWLWLVKIFYPGLNGMIVTSRFAAEVFSHYYRVRYPVAVIHNPCKFAEDGSDLDSMRIVSDSCVRLVAVGRLDPVKGFDRLVRAVVNINMSYSLEIWGDGAERQSLEREIAALNLASQVKLCGRANDVANVYCSSDLLVVSSYHEGLPNVLIEAILCGCRVVVPENLPASVELLGDIGIDGCTVYGDFESNLAVTINDVLAQSGDLWIRAQQKLASLVKSDVIACRYLDFIKECQRYAK